MNTGESGSVLWNSEWSSQHLNTLIVICYFSPLDELNSSSNLGQWGYSLWSAGSWGEMVPEGLTVTPRVGTDCWSKGPRLEGSLCSRNLILQGAHPGSSPEWTQGCRRRNRGQANWLTQVTDQPLLVSVFAAFWATPCSFLASDYAMSDNIPSNLSPVYPTHLPFLPAC